MPQQHGSLNNGDGHVDVVSSEDVVEKESNSSQNDGEDISSSSPSSEEKKENALLRNQIKIMSEQLQKNQQM